MSLRLNLATSLAIALVSAMPLVAFASEDGKPAKAASENPFFSPSPLPYHFPQFDKIHNEDYEPAFDKGMADNRAEIEAIANNPQAATFENTIVAMERSGQVLERVSRVFFSQAGTNTNDAIQALQTKLAPKLAAHSDATLLNGKLYARVKAIFDQRDSLKLDAESKRLVERYHTDFVRAGARLSDADKTRLKAINAELASLATRFSQNLLKESNADAVVVDDRSQLDGLSDDAISAAAEAAKARKLDGKFVIALMNTSGQPALASLTNRELRERIMQASLNRGGHGGDNDNRAIVAQTAKLRAERAALLGYKNHADYVLQDQTAGNIEAVNKLLGQLAPPAMANARTEAADIQKVIDAEGGNFKVDASDWAYYTEKVRQQKYAFDEQQLRPYFEMNNVLENGVFFAANKLYGLTFKERKDLPKYLPDTRIFEVFNEDGSALALFIVDYYARSNKRGGAWANAYVSQSGLLGDKPVIANHLNVPKPAEGEPTLLTYSEVNTAFHEFGHALHGMFSNVKYPRFSGTSVPRDFVEYPSQVNEMWVAWPEVLKNYAKHYKTGEPLPQALLDKVKASDKFNQGFATTEYLGAALLDQAWHQISAAQAPQADGVLAFEAAALKRAGVDFAPVPPRYRTTYFSHIMGGYSAGYYSYIWSEVLDADSVEWFKKNGGLTRKNGDHFRNTLLSRGGSEDAMVLFRNFSGGEPYVQPLLERRGLTQQGQ